MPSSESGSAGSDGNEESAAAVAGLGPGHAGVQDEDQRAREEMDRAMQDMLDEQEAEQVKKLEEMGLADKKEEAVLYRGRSGQEDVVDEEEFRLLRDAQDSRRRYRQTFEQLQVPGGLGPLGLGTEHGAIVVS